MKKTDIDEWKSDNPFKNIIACSIIITFLVFIMALIPYLVGTYLGAIPLIMVLSIDVGLFVGLLGFGGQIGFFS